MRPLQMNSDSSISASSSSAVHTHANDLLCPIPAMKNSIWRSLTLLGLFFLTQSQAATCSCSPRIYNWTLSFNETCPETLVINEGLSADSECRIQRRNMNPAVKAHTIRFLEYGENLGDLVQYRILEGMWEEGDVMTFESVTNNSTDIMPSAAAIEIDATTANNTNVQLQVSRCRQIIWYN